MTVLKVILTIIFVISAIAVTIVVLMQEGKSAGLGSLSGSTGGDSYWEKNKKYSLEGKFERWTRNSAIIMVVSAFLIMVIPNNVNANNPNPVDPTTTGAGAAVTTPVETNAADANTTPAPTDNLDAEAPEGAPVGEDGTDANAVTDDTAEADDAAAVNDGE